MKIFVTGSAERVEEFKSIVTKGHELQTDRKHSSEFDLFVDLNLDENPDRLNDYSELKGKIVLGCAVKQSLTSMVFQLGQKLKSTLGGINALPGFIARPKVELSLYN